MWGKRKGGHLSRLRVERVVRLGHAGQPALDGDDGAGTESLRQLGADRVDARQQALLLGRVQVARGRQAHAQVRHVERLLGERLVVRVHQRQRAPRRRRTLCVQ